MVWLVSCLNIEHETILFWKGIIHIHPCDTQEWNKFQALHMSSAIPLRRSYRPLTVLSFRLNWAMFGPAPFSFHVVNVVLHAVRTMALHLVGTSHQCPSSMHRRCIDASVVNRAPQLRAGVCISVGVVIYNGDVFEFVGITPTAGGRFSFGFIGNSHGTSYQTSGVPVVPKYLTVIVFANVGVQKHVLLSNRLRV